MHLHELVAGTSRGQLAEVQADAAAPARRHRKQEEEAGVGQEVGLDAPARSARAHVFRDGGRHGSNRAPSEREGLVPPKVPAERRGVELPFEAAPRRRGVAVGVPTVDEPVA